MLFALSQFLLFTCCWCATASPTIQDDYPKLSVPVSRNNSNSSSNSYILGSASRRETIHKSNINNNNRRPQPVSNSKHGVQVSVGAHTGNGLQKAPPSTLTAHHKRPNKPAHAIKPPQSVSAAHDAVVAKDDPPTYRLVCYYPNYARYRTGINQLLPANIDPYLCTHINYAFINVLPDGSIVSDDTYADLNLMGYQAITGLKQQNPDLKVLISMGGGLGNSTVLSLVAASSKLRAVFITNLLKFLQTNNFDGLDIDWEFPTYHGGRLQDKQNFPVWLKQINTAFTQLANRNRAPKYLLTIATTSDSYAIGQAYNLRALIRWVDWMNVLTYDFHTSNDAVVNNPSPLYGVAGEAQPTYNTDWVVNKYEQSGVPANQIVIGVPTYGWAWTLANPNNYKIFSAASGPSHPGPFTQTPGLLSYLEICLRLQNNSWTQYLEDDRTYAVGQGQWVGFDAPEDAAQKAQYVIDNNLGGILFWDLSLDDVSNSCGNGPYPIVNAASDVFNQNGAASAHKKSRAHVKKIAGTSASAATVPAKV